MRVCISVHFDWVIGFSHQAAAGAREIGAVSGIARILPMLEHRQTDRS